MSSVTLSYRYGFCYFRVPKAANTSIIELLYNATSGATLPVWDRALVTRSHFSTLGCSSIFNSIFLNRPLYRFAFVRNPYSRIISAYLQKFRVPSFASRFPEVPHLVGREATPEYLNLFLRYLRTLPLREWDRHWIPQHYYIWQDNADLDFIGRVERFNEGVVRLFNELQLRLPNDDLAAFRSRGSTTTDTERQMYHFLDESRISRENRHLIEEMFFHDFIRFDYPFFNGTSDDMEHSIKVPLTQNRQE